MVIPAASMFPPTRPTSPLSKVGKPCSDDAGLVCWGEFEGGVVAGGFDVTLPLPKLGA